MTRTFREKRNRIMRTRRIISLVLLLIVFILLSFYYIIKSDFFSLSNISVEGNNFVSYEEVIDISGLIQDRNIFQYNLEEIRNNIEGHPYIEKTDVKMRLPNSLLVTINEREKYAIIPYMGRFIYVDRNLNVLEVIDEYINDDLPLITGAKIAGITVGEKIQVENYGELNYIVRIVEAGKLASIINMISEINIKEDGNISLIIINGIEAIITNDNDPAYTMVSLKEILTQIMGSDNNLIIDMRFEGGFSIREN